MNGKIAKLTREILETLVDDETSRHQNCPICGEDNTQHRDDCALLAYCIEIGRTPEMREKETK